MNIICAVLSYSAIIMSSFIQFESGRKIDAAREELRKARKELLIRVSNSFLFNLFNPQY